MENLFSTVVTSALVATVAGAAINAWLDSRKSKQATRFDALSAAVTLEGYAITCADKLSGHDLAVSSEGHAGSFLGSVPELPQLSVTAGFLRPRKASVANRLMMFPQEVRQADQVIAFWWDATADIDATRNAAVTHVAEMGLRALLLAKDIREVFDLHSRDLIFGSFSVGEVLKNNLHEHSSS